MDPYVIMTIVIALAIIVGFFVWQRESGGRRLKARYGREYDRAADGLGRLRAERELNNRERRVRRFNLRSLSQEQRNRFVTRWRAIQDLFVDDPAAAVSQGDRLVEDVIDARGYPMASFEQRVEDLSVYHAAVVDHYRALRQLGDQHRANGASTEELRQALVHFRAVFEDLLDDREHVTERVVELPVERDDIRATRAAEPLRRPESELRP